MDELRPNLIPQVVPGGRGLHPAYYLYALRYKAIASFIGGCSFVRKVLLLVYC